MNTKECHSVRAVRLLLGMGVAAILAGCATAYSPSSSMLGMSRNEVIARLGSPDPMPGDVSSAARLDFPRGPYGKHTYAGFFDGSGRLIRFDQLLKEENFSKIKPGMTNAEVIEVIGVSRDRFGLARNRGYVWNYRYITPFCQWFQIEFTQENTVRSTGYGIPPECRRPKIAIF